MIVEGKVNVIKEISYLDQNDKMIKKEELIT